MNSQNSGGKFENDINVTVEDNDCDDETKLNANTEPQVGEKLNDLYTDLNCTNQEIQEQNRLYC